MGKVFGRVVLGLDFWSRRIVDRLFTWGASGAFASFGAKSLLSRPVRLGEVEGIHVGERVFFGPGCWLQTLPRPGADPPRLEVGDGCSISGACVLSAAHEVVLEPRVLLARNVYVSDHIHRYDDTTRAVLDQGVDKVRPVRIGEGAWLGQNVVVCPGVRIGRGAVVGAGSVVVDDVPDHALAVGSPARVVRRFGAQAEEPDACATSSS